MTNTTDSNFSWQQGWRYGLMGLPLAFVALPLYVVWPNFYAREYGMPLATLGAVLLGARLFDAFIDPLLGRWSDRLYARSMRQVLAWAALAAVVLATGFTALFFPPSSDPGFLIVWATGALMLTYAAYSAVSILHQSWGAMLGGDAVKRSRVVAWREGLGLIGVVTASIVPVIYGLSALTGMLYGSLLLGWWAWTRSLPPHHSSALSPGRPQAHAVKPVVRFSSGQPASLWLAFSRPDFRALLAVFLVNGVATAIPATLILFFIQDRLQVAPEVSSQFLGSYFVAAAVAIPFWLALVRRLGLAVTWALGMVLSIAVFAFAYQLGAGDVAAFTLVCVLSGFALGTDLALPGAMLAGTIARYGDQGRAEGAYLGWWNFATKLNLALAAGLALPILAWLGYAPGSRDPQALQTLTWAYCVLPCVLKLISLTLLITLIIRKKS